MISVELLEKKVQAIIMQDHHHETKFWHAIENNRIQCDLCPRFCKLKNGQRGLCFVRQNIEQQIVLTSYGRSSGFCVDPIEKKPLNHFLPGSSVLSFGTAGCNLSCKFCQNWDISKSREMDKLTSLASPAKIAVAAKQNGCSSIAFTYNDPVIFHEYAIDVAEACRGEGIKSVAVTAGYICAEPRVEFFDAMDAANVDLKSFDEKFYHKITGSHLQPVLDTLVYLKKETNVWFEITTLLIPGQNDSTQEIDNMSRWIVENLGPDVPLHFSAFHPDWKMLDISSTPLSTLKRARIIALNNGVHYVYTGNVHDKHSASSYCHRCDELLIGRDWYELSEWNIDSNGSCKKCANTLPGVFAEKPGQWGAKRLPINIV